MATVDLLDIKMLILKAVEGSFARYALAQEKHFHLVSPLQGFFEGKLIEKAQTVEPLAAMV
jgi:hypothetical protein